jgi:hypothetical protein
MEWRIGGWRAVEDSIARDVVGRCISEAVLRWQYCEGRKLKALLSLCPCPHSLHLLAFIFWNPDFSMGYGRLK